MDSTELLQYIHRIEANLFDMYEHIGWYAGFGFMLAIMAICLIFFLGWQIDRLRTRIKFLEGIHEEYQQKRMNSIREVTDEIAEVNANLGNRS